MDTVTQIFNARIPARHNLECSALDGLITVRSSTRGFPHRVHRVVVVQITGRTTVPFFSLCKSSSFSVVVVSLSCSSLSKTVPSSQGVSQYLHLFSIFLSYRTQYPGWYAPQKHAVCWGSSILKTFHVRSNSGSPEALAAAITDAPAQKDPDGGCRTPGKRAASV